jgi:hypothetical protein
MWVVDPVMMARRIVVRGRMRIGRPGLRLGEFEADTLGVGVAEVSR